MNFHTCFDIDMIGVHIMKFVSVQEDVATVSHSTFAKLVTQGHYYNLTRPHMFDLISRSLGPYEIPVSMPAGEMA